MPASTAPTHRGIHRRQPQPHGQLGTRRNLETHFIHPPIPHTTQTRIHRNRPQNLQWHPGFSPQSRLPHCGWPPISQHRRHQRRRFTRCSCGQRLQQHHLHPHQHHPHRWHHPHLRPHSRLPHWEWPLFSQHRRHQRRRETRCSNGEREPHRQHQHAPLHHLHPHQHHPHRRHHPHLRPQSRLPHWQ